MGFKKGKEKLVLKKTDDKSADLGLDLKKKLVAVKTKLDSLPDDPNSDQFRERYKDLNRKVDIAAAVSSDLDFDKPDFIDANLNSDALAKLKAQVVDLGNSLSHYTKSYELASKINRLKIGEVELADGMKFSGNIAILKDGSSIPYGEGTLKTGDGRIIELVLRGTEIENSTIVQKDKMGGIAFLWAKDNITSFGIYNAPNNKQFAVFTYPGKGHKGRKFLPLPNKFLQTDDKGNLIKPIIELVNEDSVKITAINKSGKKMDTLIVGRDGLYTKEPALFNLKDNKVSTNKINYKLDRKWDDFLKVPSNEKNSKRMAFLKEYNFSDSAKLRWDMEALLVELEERGPSVSRMLDNLLVTVLPGYEKIKTQDYETFKSEFEDLLSTNFTGNDRFSYVRYDDGQVFIGRVKKGEGDKLIPNGEGILVAADGRYASTKLFDTDIPLGTISQKFNKNGELASEVVKLKDELFVVKSIEKLGDEEFEVAVDLYDNGKLVAKEKIWSGTDLEKANMELGKIKITIPEDEHVNLEYADNGNSESWEIADGRINKNN